MRNYHWEGISLRYSERRVGIVKCVQDPYDAYLCVSPKIRWLQFARHWVYRCGIFCAWGRGRSEQSWEGIFLGQRSVAIVAHHLSIGIFECLCDVRIGIVELSQKMLERLWSNEVLLAHLWRAGWAGVVNFMDEVLFVR